MCSDASPFTSCLYFPVTIVISWSHQTTQTDLSKTKALHHFRIFWQYWVGLKKNERIFLTHFSIVYLNPLVCFAKGIVEKQVVQIVFTVTQQNGPWEIYQQIIMLNFRTTKDNSSFHGSRAGILFERNGS